MAKKPFDDDDIFDDEIEGEEEEISEEEVGDADEEEEFDGRDSGDEDEDEEDDSESSSGEDSGEDDEDEEDDPPKQPAKRKPGRPPKKKTGTTEKKPGRGRPKKDTTEDEDDNFKTFEDDDDESSAGAGDIEELPAKNEKAKGPKRRLPIETEDNEDDEDSGEEISADKIHTDTENFSFPIDTTSEIYGQSIYEEHSPEEDRKINRYRLDEESEKQADNYGFYADKLAIAKTERDTAKAFLDYTEASVDLKLRENPPKDIKITETSIAALVSTDTEVLNAKNAYISAQGKVNNLEASVTAMEHRRSQIKNLTMLWIGGYYSVPGSTRDDEQSSKVSDAMRDKLKHRSRDRFEEDEEEQED
jgi:hypothetical protein